jgi:hypothetical protein
MTSSAPIYAQNGSVVGRIHIAMLAAIVETTRLSETLKNQYNNMVKDAYILVGCRSWLSLSITT